MGLLVYYQKMIKFPQLINYIQKITINNIYAVDLFDYFLNSTHHFYYFVLIQHFFYFICPFLKSSADFIIQNLKAFLILLKLIDY